jgi:4-alpha-glucanotransferase
MSFPRSSGVLLHPTSLPGPFGIGDLGPRAFEFIEQLASARQQVWQVLPLGPTGYGDSPYQSPSAFAGNPLLISLEQLIEDGLLPEAAVREQGFQPGDVDYDAVIRHRETVWPIVVDRFERTAPARLRDRFGQFCAAQSAWLDEFALFMAVKEAHRNVAWTSWEPDIAHRDRAAIERWTTASKRQILQHKLTQFLFFEQWQRVREACHARSIEIMGDLPIFAAHDSADVWACRQFFQLDDDGSPSVVAGVPPDYFSATGQLWGNPHYRWDVLAKNGFSWWVDRFRVLLTLVDRVRIDHFRGFVAAWAVPREATTAIHGEWIEGPGAAIFEAVRTALNLDPLPFLGENLGVITPEVEALREQFGLPGMAILQFAFGTDPQAPDFRPHNYPRNRAVYTGTHDNDTTVGWWTAETDYSTRSADDIEAEREYAARYLDLDGRQVHWAFVRAVLSSVANTAIVPTQDLLGLGSEARMNRPGTPRGNWRWRLFPEQLTPEVLRRLASMTETYERA